MNDRNRRIALIFAWGTVLFTGLFKIVMQELFHFPVSERLSLGVPALVALLGLTLALAWRPLRALRDFYTILLVFIGLQWLMFTQVDRLPVIQRWLHASSFSVSMLAEQSLKLLVTLGVILTLLVLKKRPQAFFLARGDLAAPAGPVGWLGIKPGETWRTVGRNFAFFISLGTLVFLVVAGRPTLQLLGQALPMLPAVLLCAAMNAFYEETSYKASFLAVLEGAVGSRQALFLMAVMFGVLHFYGVPYGLVGVLMATFLGWFLGKSMLETRGMFWAWWIHFLQDVLIFLFLAIGSVTPGGL